MNNETIKKFYPSYLDIENLYISTSTVHIELKSNRESSQCPCCGRVSKISTTQYTRKIQDLPIINKNTTILIRLRKFKCDNMDCDVRVFAESLEELVLPKKRKTKRLEYFLCNLVLSNSADSAPKICNIKVSPDTLLIYAHKWEYNYDEDSIISIGVDDFAFKKSILM